MLKYKLDQSTAKTDPEKAFNKGQYYFTGLY